MNSELKLACALSSVLTLTAGCSSSTTRDSNPSSCTNTGASDGDAGSLRPFVPPANPGEGGFWFTASGEVLALGGYGFPPANATGIAFVDGWEMRFERLLVTFDNITLSENPDLNPGEQSQSGPAVAQIKGPWAVDLHEGGPLPGKGGSDERAIPIASLTGQNLKGCSAFDLTRRYAFGYDVVPATSAAMNVNLDADAVTDYLDMISNQYSVLYVGTATWKAADAGITCTPTDPVFEGLPKVLKFRLGFKSPASYLNCQNPDNAGEPLNANEEHVRGVYTYSNKAATVQLTIHTDHPFWESPVHDSPLHFDSIAARYVGASDIPTARSEDFAGIDYTHFTDSAGNALAWRNCQVGLYTPPDNGTMHFNSAGLALADYEAFMTYNMSTAGHLNSDGLCAVTRRQ
jgi:hypothetical protein